MASSSSETDPTTNVFLTKLQSEYLDAVRWSMKQEPSPYVVGILSSMQHLISQMNENIALRARVWQLETSLGINERTTDAEARIHSLEALLAKEKSVHVESMKQSKQQKEGNEVQP